MIQRYFLFFQALRLCERMSYHRCGPFGGHAEDPYGVFMDRVVQGQQR